MPLLSGLYLSKLAVLEILGICDFSNGWTASANPVLPHRCGLSLGPGESIMVALVLAGCAASRYSTSIKLCSHCRLILFGTLTDFVPAATLQAWKGVRVPSQTVVSVISGTPGGGRWSYPWKTNSSP
jgi:hypothetical protein